MKVKKKQNPANNWAPVIYTQLYSESPERSHKKGSENIQVQYLKNDNINKSTITKLHLKVIFILFDNYSLIHSNINVFF